MPELVWKAFIEFEIQNGENLRVNRTVRGITKMF
jgi:hypothetical protein